MQIDQRTTDHMLALAISALDATGVECALFGDEEFRRSSGATVPPLTLSQAEHAATFVDAPSKLAVALHPLTGVSGESGWVAAVRDADRPFGDGALSTLADLAALIEDQSDRSFEQEQLSELGVVLRDSQNQLRRAHDRLEVSNGELEQFAYIAAHELVSPLRAVAVYAELLGDMAESGGDLADGAAVGTAATAIRTGVSRMQEHVQQLLQLTRIESDPTPFAPVDLTEVVQRAIDIQGVDIASVGATVTLKALPTVLGQPVHLQSVFANLLSNAIRYRSPDRPLEVSITGESTDDAVVIVVTDNGVGVAVEDRQRVFAMFERGSTQEPGFGIGLSLTRRIMERHEADISLGPAPEHGCSFRLDFSLR